MNLWKIIFLIISAFVLLSLVIFIIVWEIFRKKKKVWPVKDTIIARLDIFNRKFFIEKHTNFKKVIKDIDINKWNRFSLITNLFSENIKKKFPEILNKLENKSESEEFIFYDINIYKKQMLRKQVSKKQMLERKFFKKQILKHFIFDFIFNKIKNYFIFDKMRYHFVFNKIEDSTDYLFKFNFMTIKKSNYIPNPIKIINKDEIIKKNIDIKCFIAFNMNKNINSEIRRFLELLNFKIVINIYYLKYKDLLVIVILRNKIKEIEKVILKIKKQVKKNYFANEFKYLFNGSAIAISKKISTIKSINQTLQILKFTVIDSIKYNKQFLAINSDTIFKKMQFYNHSHKLFDEWIADQNFKIKEFDIMNLKTNLKVGSYVFPDNNKIQASSYDWLMYDHQNQIKLLNAFAEKMLFKFIKDPIMININDVWLAKNIDKIENINAILIIKFNSLIKSKKINLIKKLNDKKINFAIKIKNYNQVLNYILEPIKPNFIIIDDNFWSKNKTLLPNMFMELISLNSLLKKNNIKIIYKNPSLLLDKETCDDIGLEFYFLE